MKRKLAILSGGALLSLLLVTTAAADVTPPSGQGGAATYHAATSQELLHICDMVVDGDSIVVDGSFPMEERLVLDNVSLTIQEGSTLTLKADVFAEGNSAIRGKGMIRRGEGYTGPLINVDAGASLLVEDVTIDGGAIWSGYDETDPISKTLLRGTTNSGLTAAAPLVSSCGDLTVKNAVLQNNEIESVNEKEATATGTSAIYIVGSVSLTLDDAVIRNNKASAEHGGAVTGRSATTIITVNGGDYYGNAGNSGAFFTWGKLYLEDGTIRNNYAGNDMGGGIRVASNGVLYMNGGAVRNNMTDSYGGGICLFSAKGFFNEGTVEGNEQKAEINDGAAGGGGLLLHNGSAVLNGTDFIGNKAVEGGGVSVNGAPTLTINAGEISGNYASSIGGGLRYYNGAITLNGGTIKNNTAGLGGGVYASALGPATLTVKGGYLAGNRDGKGNGDIYYDSAEKSAILNKQPQASTHL